MLFTSEMKNKRHTYM